MIVFTSAGPRCMYRSFESSGRTYHTYYVPLYGNHACLLSESACQSWRSEEESPDHTIGKVSVTETAGTSLLRVQCGLRWN